MQKFITFHSLLYFCFVILLCYNIMCGIYLICYLCEWSLGRIFLYRTILNHALFLNLQLCPRPFWVHMARVIICPFTLP